MGCQCQWAGAPQSLRFIFSTFEPSFALHPWLSLQLIILTSNQMASRLSWDHWQAPALGLRLILPAITVVASLSFNILLPVIILVTQRVAKRRAPVPVPVGCRKDSVWGAGGWCFPSGLARKVTPWGTSHLFRSESWPCLCATSRRALCNLRWTGRTSVRVWLRYFCPGAGDHSSVSTRSHR
jgi:hypothetical protein